MGLLNSFFTRILLDPLLASLKYLMKFILFIQSFNVSVRYCSDSCILLVMESAVKLQLTYCGPIVFTGQKINRNVLPIGSVCIATLDFFGGLPFND